MNKTLFVAAASAVSLVAAAGIVAPKFVASEHQKQLTILVDNINKTPNYKAEILSTESSWFGSKNTVLVGVSSLSPELKELDLETELDINTTYGPFLFSGQGILGLFESTINIAGDNFREKLVWDEATPFFELSVVGNFDGGLTFADSITEFTGEDGLVTFSGYAGQGKLSASSLLYNGTMPSFVVESPFSSVVVEDITVTMDADVGLENMMKGGFYNGTFEIKAAEIVVGSDTKLTGLSQLFATTLDKESQLGTMQFGYSLESFKYSSFEGNDFIVMSELNNLSNQYFLELTELLRSSGDVSPIETLELMQEGLNDLFATNPELNITDFRGTFPEGSFNGHLTSKLTDLDDVTFEDMMDEAFWKYNAIVSANIEADEALVVDLGAKIFAHQLRAPETAEQFKHQVVQTLNVLIQQGFIKQENGKYFSNLSIQDGEGKINDVAFPL